jgi:hypothetical protein
MTRNDWAELLIEGVIAAIAIYAVVVASLVLMSGMQ